MERIRTINAGNLKAISLKAISVHENCKSSKS